MPGRKIAPGLSKAPAIRMVPVFTSTCRSASTTQPFCGYTLPSARISSSVFSPGRLLPSVTALIRCANFKYCSSLIAKYALMGCTCETVVRIVLGPTRSPICPLARPATPSIKERTLVKLKFSFA